MLDTSEAEFNPEIKVARNNWPEQVNSKQPVIKPTARGIAKDMYILLQLSSSV